MMYTISLTSNLPMGTGITSMAVFVTFLTRRILRAKTTAETSAATWRIKLT